MGNGLIKCDLTLRKYFIYGNSAAVVTRPVLPRREGQPILMRGEVGIKDDGNLRPLVAHNTTHIDMPLHFIEGGADLAEVLNNSDYRINRPMLTRVLDLSNWSDASAMRERDGVRYCERVTADMLPSMVSPAALAVSPVDEFDASDPILRLNHAERARCRARRPGGLPGPWPLPALNASAHG